MAPIFFKMAAKRLTLELEGMDILQELVRDTTVKKVISVFFFC